MSAEGSEPEALLERGPRTPRWGHRRLLLAAAAVLGAPRRPRRRAASAELASRDDAQAKVTLCFVDVDQAVFYLAQAGNFIRFAVPNCRITETAAQRRACGAAVSTVIASFGWVASYVSSAVNSCGAQKSYDAACSASAGGFFACLGELAFIASSVTDACDFIPEDEAREDEAEEDAQSRRLRGALGGPNGTRPWAEGRRLEGVPGALRFFKEVARKQEPAPQRVRRRPAWRRLLPRVPLTTPKPNVRAASISQCVADLDLGLTYVARVGLQAYDLSNECPQTDWKSRKACAENSFNLLSSIGWAAQFLAQAAVDCPRDPRQSAACTGVVADFVATVAALGPLVNGIVTDCQRGIANSSVGDANFA
uniref:Uncharacterized protein n=1 Tax=Alexandrium monilatum TaxID=311494 RepID=A0A7S4QAI9_9DINO